MCAKAKSSSLTNMKSYKANNNIEKRRKRIDFKESSDVTFQPQIFLSNCSYHDVLVF